MNSENCVEPLETEAPEARIGNITDVDGLLGNPFEPEMAYVHELLLHGNEERYVRLTDTLIGKRVYPNGKSYDDNHNCTVIDFKLKEGRPYVTVKDYINDEEEELDDNLFHSFWTLYPPPEICNLYDKYQSRKISEGVWESVADPALIDETNRLVSEFAANEPVDYHPGTHNIVRDLVHPSMYPLLLPEGTDTTKRNFWGRHHEESKFQWLPTEFTVDASGVASIASPINNLDVDKYPALKSNLEHIFTALLPGFEKVIFVI